MSDFSWADTQIKAQYNHAKNKGYIPFYQAAAQAHGVNVADLMAISSRETDGNDYFVNHTGDAGHGHGLMQIDDRSFPDFCASNNWKDPAQDIMLGAEVLKGKIEEAMKALMPITNDMATIRRIAIAGYNGGTRRAVDAFKAGDDIDTHTTKHNYSADVIARAQIFQACLDADQI